MIVRLPPPALLRLRWALIVRAPKLKAVGTARSCGAAGGAPPAAAPSVEFYIHMNGKQMGPYGLDVLKQGVDSGQHVDVRRGAAFGQPNRGPIVPVVVGMPGDGPGGDCAPEASCMSS